MFYHFVDIDSGEMTECTIEGSLNMIGAVQKWRLKTSNYLTLRKDANAGKLVLSM